MFSVPVALILRPRPHQVAGVGHVFAAACSANCQLGDSKLSFVEKMLKAGLEVRISASRDLHHRP